MDSTYFSPLQSSSFASYLKDCIKSTVSSTISSSSLDSGLSSETSPISGSSLSLISATDEYSTKFPTDLNSPDCNSPQNSNGLGFSTRLLSFLQALETESKEKDSTMKQLVESLKTLKQQIKV